MPDACKEVFEVRDSCALVSRTATVRKKKLRGQ